MKLRDWRRVPTVQSLPISSRLKTILKRLWFARSLLSGRISLRLRAQPCVYALLFRCGEPRRSCLMDWWNSSRVKKASWIIIRQAGDTNSALRIRQGEHYVSAACSDLPPLPIFSTVLYYSIRLTWWHLGVVGETAQASVCHVMVLRLVCLLKC